MAVHIIDRRLAGKNKSIGNRERFLRRYKQQIQEAVRRAVGGRGIRDIEQSEEITIPKKDISEPIFHHGQGGVTERIHPGNKEYIAGDRFAKPKGGDGAGGSGQASEDGEGEDAFSFTLSKEEFMQIFFEDMALPRLLRNQVTDNPEWKYQRSGYSQDGTPNNLSIIRSMRVALGRRIAVGTTGKQVLAEKEDTLRALQKEMSGHEHEISQLKKEIEELKKKIKSIPYLDPIDLRFRNKVKVPVPISRAVMFCVMDISGSMDEQRKDLAKRFFILLYLFLSRHYEKTEIVFIRHHTQAQEVNEHDFFHATESGGTVVSSALELMQKIIEERYPCEQWNIYGAQASDGDNYTSDSGKCRYLLANKILPLVRYYAYIQVAEEEQNLWTEYATLLAEMPNFAICKALGPEQIFPVLRQLFQKEGVEK